MAEKPLIAFIATYDDVADARQDYEEVKQAHSKGFIGEYDAAVVWKNDYGKVKFDSVSEEASRKWLWAGLGAGALVGLIFPPSILATSAIGALSGAVIGKFRDGIPQDDLEQIGEALTADNAALVVVAEDRVPRLCNNWAPSSTPRRSRSKQHSATTRPWPPSNSRRRSPRRRPSSKSSLSVMSIGRLAEPEVNM